jgi:hypothetical protein
MNDYCDICWILLPSESHRTSHFNSDKHKLNYDLQQNLKMSSSKDVLACEICCIVANTKNQLATHLSSKNHSKKISDRDFIKDKFNEINKENSTIIDNRKLKINIKPPLSSLPSSKNSSLYSSSESIKSKSSSSDDEFVIEGEKKKIEKLKTITNTMKKTQESIKNDKKHDMCEKEPERRHKLLKDQENNKIKADDLTSISCWCNVCYVRYTSNQNRDQHINGQGHKKREEASIKFKDIVEHPNYCKLCYTMTNDKSQLERHLNSENHDRAIKQYIEFYNLIKSSTIDNRLKHELPFTVDNITNKLIDNTGFMEITFKNPIQQTSEPGASILNNRRQSISKAVSYLIDDEIEAIDFEFKETILSVVKLDAEKLVQNWNCVLNSFDKLKNSFLNIN